MVLENGEPKGMKIVSEERGLWRPGLMRMCRSCRKHELTDQVECYAIKILSSEPDFMQKSLFTRDF